MQVEVLMPKMGESITEGKIVKWHKKPGDKIQRDEILLEISTDKVDTEIPSLTSGILARILAEEQETVQVGAVVAYIDTASSNEAETLAANKLDGDNSIPGNGRAKAAGQNDVGEKFYSPLVKNIAKSEGVSGEELTLIRGSGSAGRVTKHDLMNYIEAREQKEEAPGQKFGTRGSETIPMDNMRQLIMEHMIKSRDTAVHVAAVSEVDMTKIDDYISRHGEDFEKQEGFKLTYMPFIAHSSVKALKDFPMINSSIDGTNIIRYDYVNVGIAVAIEPNGLLVPVIKDADEKNVLGLARAIRDLVKRARTKRLTGEDTLGSTFSITNFGVFGNLIGTPIINQPNVAILGVGVIKKRPVVINDAIAIRQIGFLTLSFDHRLVDGALGGRFLEKIVHNLENFDLKQVF